MPIDLPKQTADWFDLESALAEELACIRGADAARLRRESGDGVTGEGPGDETIFTALFNAGLWGLCLSGGGIRSATFALGLIQGLAAAKLLPRFDYLSTVSGGGYIGSWLSAWLHHTDDAKEVLARLGSDRSNFWTRKRHRSSTYASTATILHPKLGCSRPIPGQRYRSCCAISPSTG